MKIAIFHDYFGSIGGGEKLVIELAKGLNADIITTEVNKDNIHKILPRECRKKVRIINIGPVIQFPILKQIHSSIKFSQADFREKGYDQYIMSGNWAIFACKRHRPNSYYIHTPVRMFYDSRDFFYALAPWWAKIPFLIWVKIHSHYVQKQFPYVEKIIANSRNVQQRTKKYHHRTSVIVNPPIKRYRFIKHGDYWLAVTRLYPHKRIDMLFDVFRELPQEKLIIVGGHMKGDHSQEYMKRIIGKKPDNVKIIGEVSERELARLYGECKAFITLSRDEDFGMTVLEANSAGKPVIATNEGGHRETVINGKTGYLVRPNITDITSKIRGLSHNAASYSKECKRQAQKFSTEIFLSKIKNIVGSSNFDKENA